MSPLGGALLTVFATTAFWYIVIERERRYIRQAFGRYVSPALLARIEQSPEALRLGGVNREITVLFMDVRGFTSLSETLSPQETIRFLNTVHGALSVPVVELDGTLDKYIGDSLMAFWNAPLDVGEHAAKAAEAALRMREALRRTERGRRLRPSRRPAGPDRHRHPHRHCLRRQCRHPEPPQLFGRGRHGEHRRPHRGRLQGLRHRHPGVGRDGAPASRSSAPGSAGEVQLRGKSHADQVFFLDGRAANDLA